MISGINSINRHMVANSAMGCVSRHSDGPKVHTDRLDDIQLIKAESGEGQQAHGIIWVMPHSEKPANSQVLHVAHCCTYHHMVIPSIEITNTNAYT